MYYVLSMLQFFTEYFSLFFQRNYFYLPIFQTNLNINMIYHEASVMMVL